MTAGASLRRALGAAALAALVVSATSTAATHFHVPSSAAAATPSWDLPAEPGDAERAASLSDHCPYCGKVRHAILPVATHAAVATPGGGRLGRSADLVAANAPLLLDGPPRAPPSA